MKKYKLKKELCDYYAIDIADLDNMLTRGYLPHQKEVYVAYAIGDGDIGHHCEYIELSDGMRRGIEKAAEIYNFYVFSDSTFETNYLDFDADLLVDLYYDIKHLFFSILSNQEILSILDNQKSAEEIQDELKEYAKQKIKNQK